MEVLRYLITGNGGSLTRFDVMVETFANPIERREQTVFYTVYADRVADFLRAAEVADVTVEELERYAEDEDCKLLRLGADELRWTPRG